MTLSRIILGFLSLQPMTGYDLMRAFAGSAAYFWHADKAQIYRTLAKLVDEGLARLEAVPGEKGRDRIVHHPTAEGREALAAWLSAPAEPFVARDPFVARIFFGADLDDEELARVIDARADEAVEARDRLGAVRSATPSPDPATDRGGWLRSATLDQGIREIDEHLAWLGRLRSELAVGERR